MAALVGSDQALKSGGSQERFVNQQEEESKSAPLQSSSSPGAEKNMKRFEWPLFPTPSVNILQVTGYEIYNNSVYFTILIGMGGTFQWSVLKTYDEFALLNKMLVEYYAIDKTLFPQRKMFGTHKKDYITELQGRLSLYLSSILQRFSLPPVHLLQFLEYKFSDVLSITETLSALFFERGDEFLQTNSMIAFSPLQLHCVCKRLVLPIASEHINVKHDFGHLLDFLQHLRKVKICPPSRELFPLSSTVNLDFEISVMKSLNTLVLQNIDINMIKGLGDLPRRIETLGVHQGLTAPRDILKHTGIEIQCDAYMEWSCLRVIDFTYNNITSIDSSLSLAPNLEELNVSHNSIKDIDNLLELPHLRILDLSNNQLESLSDLHCRLGNITTLCLAKNNLTSLKGLEKCYSIVCMDIQNNKITRVNEMSVLSSLPLLEQLLVKGNPFTNSPSYRQNIFSLLPKTARQVSLDGQPPSKDELEVSASISNTVEIQEHTHKSKKSSTRVVDIKGEDEDDLLEEKSQSVPPVFTGARRHIEQMKKEGGDNWLSLLNQQQKQSSPSNIRKKAKHRKTGNRVRNSSSGDLESSSECSPVVHALTPSSGLPSSHLYELLNTRECSCPWSCSASVLEYHGLFPQLSHHDIEQLVTGTKLKSCLLIVDTPSGRITEDYVISGGNERSRNTRDLTFLREVRVHEGKSLAVAMEITTFMSHSSWIIYRLKDYPSLADLFLLLSRKLRSVSDVAPPSPALLAKQISINDDTDNVETKEELKQNTEDEKLETSSKGDETLEQKKRSQEILESEDIPTGPVENTPDVPSTLDKKTSSPDKIMTLDLSTSERDSRVVKRAMSPIHIEKPGLENQRLLEFFRKNVARDSGEVLMHVLWCAVCLPSTAPLEVEGAVFISNMCLYVLEVKGNGEWDGEDLPLLSIVSAHLEHLSKVMIVGVFDQNIHIELHNISPVNNLVVFPPTSELTCQLIEQLKAALDASGLHFTVMEALEAKQAKGLSGVLFITPDSFSISRLKEWLSYDKTNVQLANFLSTHMNKSILGMYEVELKQGQKEMANSFDIVQHLVVCCVEPGVPELHTLVLLVTNADIFLYQESFINGPALRFTPLKHSFPPLSILHSLPISSVKSVTVYDRPQTIHSSSDSLYHFCIEFNHASSLSLYLCIHNQQYLNRLLSSLKLHWEGFHSDELPVNHTSNVNPFINKLLSSPVISPVSSSKHRPNPPLLVKTEALLQFNGLPHWAKYEVFKEHIAQADFLKSDETILAVSLARCVPSLERKLEVEVCVIVSNYGLYFLTDINGIRLWLDAGGISSFARMSLLNPEGGAHLQCFYRLWITDLKRVSINSLYLSLRLYENKPNTNIDIVTSSPQLTASILTALASRVTFVDPKVEEKKGDLLEEFIDISEDPFGEETESISNTSVPSLSTNRPSVELIVPTDASLNDLKLHLVESQPDVARGSSVLKCAECIRILVSQVILLAEQLRVRDSIVLHYRPHLALITNYGIFICGNAINPNSTPCLSLATPTQIVVKRWSRIDDVIRVQVALDPLYRVPQVLVYVRPPDNKEGISQMCFVSNSLTEGKIFVYQLGLIWAERMGHTLPIEYVD